MILLDTSVWIRFLRGDSTIVTTIKDELDRIAICGPVIQEVLQGFRDDLSQERFKRDLLAFKMLGDPLDSSYFMEAATLYRTARKNGVTIRSSVDCLIATIAIRHRAEVWHFDRDYSALASVSPLRVRSIR